MKKFFVFAFVVLLGLSFYNCGNNYSDLVTKLYMKNDRKAAIETLKKADTEKAFPYLVKALGAKDDDTVNAVIQVLKAWPKDSTIKKLETEFAQTENITEAQNIIKAMWNIGGAEAENFMIKVLNDKRTLLVSMAILGLGEIKSQTAVDKLLTFLTPDNITSPLFQSALIAVGKIGTPKAIEPLKNLLSNPINSITLKINIMKTLFTIDKAHAEDYCIDALKKENDPRILAFIIRYLGFNGTKKSVQALENAKKKAVGMDDLINKAVEAINKRGQ